MYSSSLVGPSYFALFCSLRLSAPVAMVAGFVGLPPDLGSPEWFSPAAVLDLGRRFDPGVTVVAAMTVTPVDLLCLRFRPRRGGASSSAVGQSGGPVQELAPRRSSSAGMMLSVHLRAPWVPGGDDWSVVDGAALLRLLRRLKMVVPGFSEHGFSPADAPQGFDFVDLRQVAESAHKVAGSAMVLSGSSLLGFVGVIFLKFVCFWDFVLCMYSVLCVILI